MSEQTITDDLKTHVQDSNVWKRLLYMILFAILYSAAEVVLVVVVIYQFFCLLFTGNKNEKVLSFGAQLSSYIYQVFSFQTFNTETKPFPMSDWPSDQMLVEKEEPIVAAATTEKPKRAPRKPAATKTPAKKAAVKPRASRAKPAAKVAKEEKAATTTKPAEDDAAQS